MTTLAAGPPGIEVRHRWNGSFVLNDFGASPFVKVARIQGFHGLSEADDARSVRPGFRGEIGLPVYARGKTVVYEGEVRARTLQGLREKSTSFRNAFRDRQAIGNMALLGDPEWSYNARVMQLDMDDEQFTSSTNLWPFRRRFQLGLRMLDSRFYAAPAVTVGAASGASATATNLGWTDTDPIFTVTLGATADLTLTNSTLGRTLRFDGVTAGTVTVDFRHRSISSSAGGDQSGKLNIALSDWWDEGVPGLAPGDNVVAVTGGNWTVQFYHASE